MKYIYTSYDKVLKDIQRIKKTMTEKQYNGVSYYMYFWCPEEKKWILCKQRFIVSGNDTNNNIYGQFLTSMWLNWSIDCKRSQGFVIAG